MTMIVSLLPFVCGSLKEALKGSQRPECARRRRVEYWLYPARSPALAPSSARLPPSTPPLVGPCLPRRRTVAFVPPGVGVGSSSPQASALVPWCNARPALGCRGPARLGCRRHLFCGGLRAEHRCFETGTQMRSDSPEEPNLAGLEVGATFSRSTSIAPQSSLPAVKTLRSSWPYPNGSINSL